MPLASPWFGQSLAADGRDLVAVTLEHYGARVMTAASAAEALDLLQTTPVNLLLADIAMPDEDGYGLIRTIRALPSPRQAAIPAAALTSFARGEDRQQAIQAGFQLHERLAARPTREEMLSRLHSRRRVTLKTAASTVIREERESA